MKKLTVNKIIIDNGCYKAYVQENVELEKAQSLQAGNRMLVDSDGLAFVYILEDDSAFYYVSFPQETWSNLKDSYEQTASLMLILAEDIEIELTSIKEELSFLIENIEGNSNYGEEMERAVQEIFS
ncbi:hypothetical protein ACFFHM_03000 [Halalkalibacter kiskunsagensis]|uniref:UPF0738 protein ACFFHM_03000 n=1 Tax=Halalkalibacter kiskunsagensis TaxID=1548599 RepID=A0ABV6K898_9BACI